MVLPSTKLTKGAGIATLEFLEKSWPEPATPKVVAAFEELKSTLKGKPAEAKPMSRTRPAVEEETTWPVGKATRRPFDTLDVVRQVLSSHDLLFLSRQVTYHISASTEVPKVWADAGQVSVALSRMVEHIAKRAAPGSQIAMELKGVTLQSGPGVELICTSTDRLLDKASEQQFLTTLFQEPETTEEVEPLAEARRIILRQQGQLWADIPKPQSPNYHVILPASAEAARPHPGEQWTYKYDISINNYSLVRKRFGIRKSLSLVEQIERYVRSLVRYPMDMVMAIGDKGVITTIYETQHGAAESVASRISQRLGKESFRIGKRPVDLSFSYHLSLLNPPPASQPKGSTSRQSG